MIKNVFFCKSANVKAHLLTQYLGTGCGKPVACIHIGLSDDDIPVEFRPVLNLDFSTYDPLKEIGIHVDPRKQRNHRERFETLRDRHPTLPSDKDAEKIIIFCNELFKDSADWDLWIMCPDGRRTSASIARFVDALQLGISVRGFDCISTDWQSLFLSGLLAYNYGRMFTRQLAEAKANESHANSESALRGKKD